jgi:cell division transport system ATP-binding protein
MATAMIRAQQLSKAYVKGQPVIDKLSLHLQPGSFTFLMGASGAGKSTLLSMLSLALKPNSGSLELFGQDVTQLAHYELPDLRRRIGSVFQDYQLLNHLSVAENVALPLKVLGEAPKVTNAKVAELLEWIGLADKKDEKPTLLSGGQKQRVAIARAVINNPAIIIADEPTGNLDATLSMRLMHLFTTLNKIGTTILFATHDDHLVSHFDYDVIYLKDGQISRQRRP